MKRIQELARRLALLEHGAATGDVPLEKVESLAAVIADRFGEALLPGAGESAAFAVDAPKTAALFFDRVWCAPAIAPPMPRDVTFYGATDTEIWSVVTILATRQPEGLSWSSVQTAMGDEGPLADLWARADEPAGRLYCDVFSKDLGITVVPVYSSAEGFAREYTPGATDTLMIALEGLSIVDEKALAWDQVIEFRADPESRNRLRRLRHWADASMVGKSVSFLQDELGIRLTDYNEAIRKHGLKTTIGTATEVLDPRFLAGTSTVAGGLALAGLELWAAAAGAGALVGRVALSIGTRLIDINEARRRSEVAFISELSRLTDRTPR